MAREKIFETRVKKYETYRKNISKSKSEDILNEDRKPSSRVIFQTNTLNTTSALPIDDVVQTLNEPTEEEIALKKQRRKELVKQILIIGGLALAACLIIVVGIIIFSK